MIEKIKMLSTILIVVLTSQSIFSQALVDNSEQKQIKYLTQSSEIVLIGKVSSRESFWNEDKSRIFTKVNIEAEEYLKQGVVDLQLVLKKNKESAFLKRDDYESLLFYLGGEIGEVGELYTHLPRFNDQEELLLFAKKNRSNQYIVAGGELGKIRIIRDEISGKKLTASKKSIETLKNEIRLHIQK